MLTENSFMENQPGEYRSMPAAVNADRNRLAADYLACRQVMHKASKNYTFASYLLPGELRPHVEALYALVRVGDDRVDVNHTGYSTARSAIEEWQAAYWRAFEVGDSPHPVLRAYLNTAHTYEIPAGTMTPYFQAMIDDLTVYRYQAFEHLLHYMEGSAIPVGRAMCHILGTTTPQVSDAYPSADSLAIAMQLSNFWRDIGEDWQRGRVYIPQEDMLQFGVTEDDLANRRVTENFIALLQFEIERTRTYYADALAGVGSLRTGRWGVVCSLNIYQAILDDIERRGYDVYPRRAGASTWRKFLLAAQARWIVALRFAAVD